MSEYAQMPAYKAMIIEQKAAYNKEWRSNNKEICRAYSTKWRLSNPEKSRLACKNWCQNNKETVAMYQQKWRAKYPEKAQAKDARSALGTDATPEYVAALVTIRACKRQLKEYQNGF